MANSGTELTSAPAIASRLRLLQAELADMPDKERQGHLLEEARRQVDRAPRDQRDALKRELGAVLSGRATAQVVTEKAVSAVAPQVVTKPLGPDDAPRLAADIVRLLEKAPPAIKAEVLETLIAGGAVPEPVAPSAGGSMPAAVAATLRKAMAIGDSTPCDPASLAEVAGEVSKTAFDIHAVAWRTWRQIAPDDRDARGATLPKVAALHAQTGGQLAKVGEENAEFRRMTLAMVVALSRVSRQVAEQFASKYAPEVVQAGAKKGGMMTSQKVINWEHYEALWQHTDAQALEQDINRVIAETINAIRRQGQK